MPTLPTEIIYSQSGTHYYITGLEFRPRSWVPVTEGDILPFVFWKVTAGTREPIADDHELVLKYRRAENMPTPGGPRWCEKIDRLIENEQSQVTNARRSLQYHEDRLAYLTTLRGRHP